MNKINRLDVEISFCTETRRRLLDNLEEAFMKLDTASVSSRSFSGENIRRRYPKLWELYVTLLRD